MKKSLFIFYFIATVTFLNFLNSADSMKLSQLEAKEIEISVKHKDPIYLGRSCTFYFNTNYKDTENIFDDSDIEEKTTFKTTIKFIHSDDINCFLWKPINGNIVIFCKIVKEEYINYTYVTLAKASFIYNNYEINIIPPSESFSIKALDMPIPILCSNEQIINIEKDKSIYEVKFRLIDYENQPLFLYSSEIKYHFDKCSSEEKYLICKITKDEIEEISEYNNQTFNIYTHNNDYYLGIYKNELISDIIINDDIITKENIYVYITQLAQNVFLETKYMTYKTNVTNISNVVSSKFNYQKEYSKWDYIYLTNCYFKKTDKDPLLLLCEKNMKQSCFGELREEIILNNSNIKYNFRIQPVTRKEIAIFDVGFTALFSFPKLLNFTSSDEFVLNYLIKSSIFFKNIKLYTTSPYLHCKEIRDPYVKCIVSRKYFENQKSGYYYTYVLSKEIEKYAIVYEFTPIHVIIPNDKKIYVRVSEGNYKDTIIVGKNKILKMYTKFNNNEMKIFDKNKIREIKFQTTISDKKNNTYQIDCYFIESNNENLGIVCTLNEDIKNETQEIMIDDGIFKYNDYTIIVFTYDYLKIEQYDSDIPFLYSEEQIINISEQEKTYYLYFQINMYYNDFLVLYDLETKMKYATLNDCQINNGKLKCSISKEKLEEILSINNEKFGVIAINDEIGMIPLIFIKNISINYYPIEKEDIFINLIKVIDAMTETGNPIALFTNITSIQDLNTLKFGYCRFKKTKHNPLFMLCYYDLGVRPQRLEEKYAIVLNYVHYKYNFILLPYSFASTVSVNYIGTGIYQMYPEEINLISQNYSTIKLITENSSSCINIAFSYLSSYSYLFDRNLTCQSLKGIKKCNISASNFNITTYKSMNYFYISHSKTGKITLDLQAPPIKIILPKTFVNISIESNDNLNEQILCQNGIIYLITNYNDTENNKDIFGAFNNEDEISYNTLFKMNTSDIYYNLNCKFWKPKNKSIITICHSDKNVEFEDNILINASLENTEFENDDIKITISFNGSFLFRTVKSHCPFLYADEQTIQINEKEESYKLNFKIVEYNNEKLLLIASNNLNNIILDDCYQNNINLICTIKKQKIFEQCNSRKFKLYFINEQYGFKEFALISNISFISTIKKTEIEISIIGLKETTIDFDNFVPYETNFVDKISLVSDYFIYNPYINIFCYFKKVESEPLLMLCHWDTNGSYYLGYNSYRLKEDNINIKYDFIILKFFEYTTFTIGGSGSYISFLNPLILDFNINDTLNISIRMENPENTHNISLGSSSQFVDCNNYNKSLISDFPYKKCTIHKDYFKDNKNQSYYYIYHQNHLSGLSKFYELSPIQVILPEDNQIIIQIKKEDNVEPMIIGTNGVIYLITDYYDNEKNILEGKEDSISFDSSFKDLNNNEYMASCRIWIPKNEAVRLLCSLKKNLKYQSQNIKINTVSFVVNEYKFIINSSPYIQVNQISYSLSFLYSDKQEINVNDKTDLYLLKFKKLFYYKEKLKLYKEKLRRINLNCNEEEKEVICTLSKKNILKYLSKNGEKFLILQITNFNEIIPKKSILDITINYIISKKTQIYVQITKLLTSVVELNNFVAFETNITSISCLTSSYFNIKRNSNSITNCLFKKNNERNDDKLLLLCDATLPGKSSLGNINEINLEDINILYTFKIAKVQNDENFIVTNKENTIIYSVYPEEIDFNKNDNFIIKYETDYPERLTSIKLNNDSSSELECTNLNGIKECKVTQDHFTKNGDYHTYHENSLGYNSISYEVSTIRVTMKTNTNPEQKRNLVGIIVGSIIGGLVLIAIIIIIVWRVKIKRSKYNAIEKEILNSNNMELQLE